MAQLNSSKSVVDFLKSRGQDSSTQGRSKLFNQLGLNKDMGDFSGTPQQNEALLKRLQRQGVENQTSQELTNMSIKQSQASPELRNMSIKQSQASPELRNMSIQQTQASPELRNASQELLRQNGLDVVPPDFNGQNAISTPALNFLRSNSFTAPFADALDSTGQQAPQPTQTPEPETASTEQNMSPLTPDSWTSKIIRQAQERGESTTGATTRVSQMTPEEIVQENAIQSPIGGVGQTSPAVEQAAALDTQTEINTGVSASSILGNQAPPSEADLINEYLNSSEGQLMIEKNNLKNKTSEVKAEIAKRELEAKYASEKSSVEQSLATNGLAFSGIRASAVASLAQSLAQSSLDVDRDFALSLLNADINFRESILKGVSSLISDAWQEEERAIKQLNSAGFAVVGDLLVPTLQRENAERNEIYQEARLKLEQQRVDIAISAENRKLREATRKASGVEEEDNRIESLIQFITSDELRGVPERELVAEAVRLSGLPKSTVELYVGQRVAQPAELTEAASSLLAEEFANIYDSNNISGVWFTKGRRETKEAEKQRALKVARQNVINQIKNNPNNFSNIATINALAGDGENSGIVSKVEFDLIERYLDGSIDDGFTYIE